jgi:hypothetical protein
MPSTLKRCETSDRIAFSGNGTASQPCGMDLAPSAESAHQAGKVGSWWSPYGHYLKYSQNSCPLRSWLTNTTRKGCPRATTRSYVALKKRVKDWQGAHCTR